ncbi:NADPH-dependent FMN reductase [Actinomadura oligospora]|uniref:NADPH-dependent FMN reductase n=1 Tax=Actinomadura oligospora TaxID=111804 RepID=UPI00068552E6|nr:NAD(P)H-dependent oxidoreductase [Actinomadura oligospora]
MSSHSRPLVVGIGGTIRAGSTSERTLRFALSAAADLGAEPLLLTAAELHLPAYRPGSSARTARARRFVEALRAAEGVLVASPAYHGGMSGLLKNALDHAEDLRDDARPYLDGRAVGCIATGAGWQGPAATLAQMRGTAHALRGWPTPLGVVVNSSQPCFEEAGVPVEHYRTQLRIMAGQVVGFARLRMGAAALGRADLFRPAGVVQPTGQ